MGLTIATLANGSLGYIPQQRVAARSRDAKWSPLQTAALLLTTGAAFWGAVLLLILNS